MNCKVCNCTDIKKKLDSFRTPHDSYILYLYPGWHIMEHRCILSFKESSFYNVRYNRATLCGHSASRRFMASQVERFICRECMKLQSSAVFCLWPVRETNSPLLWDISKHQRGVMHKKVASTNTCLCSVSGRSDQGCNLFFYIKRKGKSRKEQPQGSNKEIHLRSRTNKGNFWRVQWKLTHWSARVYKWLR